MELESVVIDMLREISREMDKFTNSLDVASENPFTYIQKWRKTIDAITQVRKVS